MWDGTAMRSVFFGAVVATLILFSWSYVSWMVLPWHQGQDKVYQTMQATTTGNGERVTGIQVNIGGSDNLVEARIVKEKPAKKDMTYELIAQAISQFIAAWLVGLLLLSAGLSRFGCRMGFILTFALAAGVSCYAWQWIWFKIPVNYFLVNMTDLVISWFLAGLALAWLVKKPE